MNPFIVAADIAGPTNGMKKVPKAREISKMLALIMTCMVGRRCA